MREALEAVHGLVAIENIAKARAKQRFAHDAGFEAEDFAGGRDDAILRSASPGRSSTGEAAREVADKPRLTGDPEWDALELDETDPSREPLKVAY